MQSPGPEVRQKLLHRREEELRDLKGGRRGQVGRPTDNIRSDL